MYLLNENIDNLNIRVFGNKDSNTILYFHGEIDESNLDLNILYVIIDGNDWNRDFTPYKAESIFKKQEPFTGEAHLYLEKLKQIIVHVEKNLKIQNRIICGYSLSGLFSLYASLNTNLFNYVGLFSASCWYKGFKDYTKNHINKNIKYAYFSIGDKENQSKNVYMKDSISSIEYIYKLFCAENILSDFYLENGNHFENIDERIKKGINFILKKI